MAGGDRVGASLWLALVLTTTVACSSKLGGSNSGGAGIGGVSAGIAGAGGGGGAGVGGAGGSVGTGAPDSVVEACLELQEAMAAWWTRCVGGSAADWRAYLQEWQGCATVADDLLAGRVAYRPELFSTCVAELQEACDQGPDNFCPFAVIRGQVLDGQPCRAAHVCGLDSTCFRVGTETCGEVCAHFGGENQTCGLYCGGVRPCLDGPYCAADLACVNNRCVQPKGLGAACTPADPLRCSGLLHCTADPADAQSSGTCQPNATGAACHVDPDCPASDFCWQGICTARRAQGQPCVDAPAGCAAWTVCDPVTGSCVRAGKPGQPCLLYPGTDYRYCQIGACNAENVCISSANPGERCDVTYCAPGSSCDSSTLTCVACGP